VARAAGEPRLTARLHGAAAARWEALSIPIPLAIASRHEPSIAALRATLGAEFAAVWEGGKTLTVDDALRETERLISAAIAAKDVG
jgi:short subunit dehydrogenase-like uncharacterized protein